MECQQVFENQGRLSRRVQRTYTSSLLVFLTRAGVAEAERQLSVIEVHKLTNSMTPKSDLRKNAPDFQFAYLALLAVISPKLDGSTNPTNTILTNMSVPANSSVLSAKCPSDIPVDPGSSKRPKSASNQAPSKYPATPDQPTVLPNPNYSGDSNLSGASNESGDEELSKEFFKSFR